MPNPEFYRMPSSAARILKEKTVLLVLPPSGFSEPEFDYIYQYLRKARLGVKIATTSKTARGSAGLEVKPTVRLSELEDDDFDALVVLGDSSGASVQALSQESSLASLLRKACAKKRILGAIGVAVHALVACCPIKGRMMTAWRDPSLVSLIEQKGGSFVWEPVVVDGNLITADGPSSISMFTEALIDALTRRGI